MAEAEPKLDHWWAFPVGAGTHQLSAGARALLEAVRDDPSIRKVVLTRSRRVDLEGQNLRVLPFGTREALESPGSVRFGAYVDGDPDAQLEVPDALGLAPVRARGRGVAHCATRPDSQRGGSRDTGWPLARSPRAPRRWRALLPRPLPPWPTCGSRASRGTTSWSAVRPLPDDLARDEAALRARVGGRRLLVFWPRPGGVPPRLQAQQIERLRDWAARHNVVIGVREPVVDRADSWTFALGPLVGLGVSPRAVAYGTTVLRVADAVVTDEADEAVDFLLTGKQLLHLAAGARWGRHLGGSVLPAGALPFPVRCAGPSTPFSMPSTRPSSPSPRSTRTPTSAPSAWPSRTSTTATPGGWPGGCEVSSEASAPRATS